MNRKHNPFVALVALILLAVVVVCICAGCTAEASAECGHRFSIKLTEIHSGPGGGMVQIITDTETGAQYMFYKFNNAGGLTKLEG